MRDAVCFGLGLCVGLWVAANIWFTRYALGYKAGVKMCLEQLEPVRVEIDSMLAGLPVHRVSEEMRLKMEAAQELNEGGTRH